MMYLENNYYADIVFCIDKTSDMSIYKNDINNFIMKFCSCFEEEMVLVGKYIEQFRARVIAFGDYQTDAEPMIQSEFFNFPNQIDDFKHFIESINYCGGGDSRKNAFEALSLAVNSDFVRRERRRRHIICLITNAPPLPWGEREGCPGYPTDIPQSFEEFASVWEGTDSRFEGSYSWNAGRLVAFVPRCKEWEKIEVLNRTVVVYNDNTDDNILGDICIMVTGAF